MPESKLSGKIIILIALGSIFLIHNLSGQSESSGKLDFSLWKNGRTLAESIRQRKTNRMLKTKYQASKTLETAKLRTLEEENEDSEGSE